MHAMFMIHMVLCCKYSQQNNKMFKNTCIQYMLTCTQCIMLHSILISIFYKVVMLFDLLIVFFVTYSGLKAYVIPCTVSLN